MRSICTGFSFTKFAQLDQAEAALHFILHNINKGDGYVGPYLRHYFSIVSGPDLQAVRGLSRLADLTSFYMELGSVQKKILNTSSDGMSGHKKLSFFILKTVSFLNFLTQIDKKKKQFYVQFSILKRKTFWSTIFSRKTRLVFGVFPRTTLPAVRSS